MRTEAGSMIAVGDRLAGTRGSRFCSVCPKGAPGKIGGTALRSGVKCPVWVCRRSIRRLNLCFRHVITFNLC